MENQGSKSKTKLKNRLSKLTAKQFFGAVLFLIGAQSIVKVGITQTGDIDASINNLLTLILGTLTFIVGIGLIVLDNSERKNENKDSINIFIGKQLFEKGLQGILIGVLVGSLNLVIELFKMMSQINK